ncbi:MAG: hypothetical protein U0324_10305 [Polyangiales bacterium]
MRQLASPSSALVLCALLGAGSAGCGARLVPLRDQGAVLLATPAQEADVRAAIARALAARGFTAEAEQPNKIVARLDSRGMVLRVSIDYSATQYVVAYIDSQGYNFQVGPQGPMISARYNQYTENLRRSIQEELGRPAREAQAAVQAQRDHELALAEAQRQQQNDALAAQAAERDRDRQAALERERLRTERAHAEAEARRPIIVGHDATAVVGLRFNAGQVQGARGTIRLNPGFTPDPRTINGRAGGDVSAAQMGMPNGCTGFYAGTAAHTVFLARDFNYLRMETSAPTDTTLAVVAPDGSVWCDDDGAGNTNARIAGQFPAGPYRIFVGNYQQGVVSPFQLVITEYEAQNQVPVAVPVQPEPPPAPAPDCRGALLAAGHHASNLIFCNDVPDRCAVALLQAGHHPSNLIHCRGVEPNCAEQLLRSGQHPSNLIHCPH